MQNAHHGMQANCPKKNLVIMAFSSSYGIIISKCIPQRKSSQGLRRFAVDGFIFKKSQFFLGGSVGSLRKEPGEEEAL